MGQTLHLLFIFIIFTMQDKYCTNLTINGKNIDGVLETQTQGGRMVGADESTELCRHPINCFFFVFFLPIHVPCLSTAPVLQRQRGLYTLLGYLGLQICFITAICSWPFCIYSCRQGSFKIITFVTGIITWLVLNWLTRPKCWRMVSVSTNNHCSKLN